ncbi:MAG TPA: 2-oxoglutarate dehydrogenase E1 component [Longimicrobiales bacterium]|nr:2-oxoglutarate dehydrogenase E1 component [Longimicrobiales bacterium]
MRQTQYDSLNAAYVQSLFDRYLQNPAAVDATWRQFFETGGAAGLLGSEALQVTAPASGVPTTAQLRAARAFGELIDAYRLHGHTAAHLDPLGSKPHPHPMLFAEFHGATEDEIAAVPAEFMDLAEYGETTRDVLEFMRRTYTGTIGYEYEYLEDPSAREWLREQIESGALRQPLSTEEKRRLLSRLTEVEAFEQFIHKSYLGAKRFSIEGTDMMVPMLDLAIERAAAGGAREIAIGMAHRGRLNVLAHVLGVPYTRLIAKFEGKFAYTGGTGDVKYHLGAEGTYATASGEPLSVVLAPNPSHLEFVNAVVSGMARAKQSNRAGPQLQRNESSVLPVLIHGDAAFSGQGVVPETLNLAKLDGYRIGGTLHVIANNQVGFTTDPKEARSTDYSSDLARGFDIPIFHVNADDPEACLAAIRLALGYRERFHADVVVDLVGYRRYGHNEADEPAYTQPVMYHKIAEHPSVRRIWATQLEREGVVSAAEVEAVWKQKYDALVEVQAEVKRAPNDQNQDREQPEAPPAETRTSVVTKVDAETLRGLDRQLHSWPREFAVNPKLARQLERRARLLGENGAIEWAHAEALALASLLVEGVPVRMTGQDTERGTFSQRHLVLHDTNKGTKYAPIQHLAAARAPFEIYNSPLSELAVVGFEYGYSVVAPESLVLWEAQFGDFANGAQVIIDQFIAAGYAKWGQKSRLVMLLPHGYEGQGPEHSSARLERFLQLAAESNLRIANCTTPAQYFHILRCQALLDARRPLIMMTPKSLLRHPRSTSRLDDLARGSFRTVIDDATAQSAGPEIQRIVLCSGKVYFDLLARREKENIGGVALVRIEELYPFPADELRNLFAQYSAATEAVWTQEEPENMGAWRYLEPRLRGVAPEDFVLSYCGRPERASPAEGYASDHELEQERIVTEALSLSAARRA